MAVKLILDTDIGTDVDDAWALALCLGAEEIELLGVTLVHADLEMRSKIALKMLKMAGRLDVPVYKGISNTLTQDGKLYWPGHEGKNTDFSDVEGLAAREGAVEYILETVERYPGEVVVCPIGPVTNVAEAIRRNPGTMSKVKRLAIMGSTFNGEGGGVASPEHNCAVDPLATKIVYQSDIPATVVGLNVTMQVAIDGKDVQSIEGTSLGDYLARMTYEYFDVRQRDFTHMHDPLAVATQIDPTVVSAIQSSSQVLEDGRVAWLSTGDSAKKDVCVSVDMDKFKNLLFSKVKSLVCKGV